MIKKEKDTNPFHLRNLQGLPSFLLAALFFVSFLSAEGGCKKKPKNLDGGTLIKKEEKATFLMKSAGKNFPSNLKTYSAKADLGYSDEGQSISASAQLVWKKDEILWIVVKKFGFEAVRAMVTPDSIFVLNRLENTVMARSTDWLAQKYQVPGGFDLLSHILFGQAFFPENIEFKSGIKDSLYMLTGQDGPYSMDYRLEGGTFQLVQAIFAQPQASRFMGVAYGSRIQVNGFILPTEIDSETYADENGKMSVRLKLKNIEVNKEQEVRFSIPSHYKNI